MMYITYGLLSGFGHIMIFNSSSLVILQYFVKWRSLAVGIVSSAPAIGMFVITQLTQAMLDAFGWQWTVRGFSVLYFVCCFCSTAFVPLGNREEEHTDKKTSHGERRMTSLFRNRSFLILLTSLAVDNFSYYVPHVHIVSTRLLLRAVGYIGIYRLKGCGFCSRFGLEMGIDINHQPYPIDDINGISE